MIEYIVLTNFLSFKDETRFEFTASMEKPKKGFEYMKWFETVNKKKILKAQFLFGNNATGKSNFLSSLSFIREIICGQKKSKTDGDSQIPDTYFKLSSSTIDQPSILEIAFHTAGIRYTYHVSTLDNTILEEKLSRNSSGKKEIIVFTRKYDKDKDIAVIEFAPKLFDDATEDAIRKSVIKNTSVISVYDEKNFESDDFRNVYHYFFNSHVFFHFENIHLPSMLDNRKDKVRLKKLLLPLLQDLGSNIVDYEVSTIKEKVSETESKLMISLMGEDRFKEQYPNGERKMRTVRFAHIADTPSKVGWLSESEESYGTLNMIRLIVLFYDASIYQCPLAVDECSVGIHQQTFGRIIQFFLSTFDNMQFFLASQQISLMEMDGFRRDTVKFFDKNRETGVSICKKIDLKKYHKNLSIVNAYFNNSFGCLPEFPSQEQWKEKLTKYKNMLTTELN